MHTNQKKEIIYFDERFNRNDFLHLAMAGKTLPNPNYLICHTSKMGEPWNYYNFEYIVSGKGYIETNGQLYTVQTGDLFFLNKLKEHTYYADREHPYEKLFIVVEGSFVDNLLDTHQLTKSVAIVHADVYKIFEQIFNLANKYAGTFFDATSYTELSCALLRMVQLLSPPNFNVSKTEESPAARIKNYIDHNIYEKISLPDIANMMKFSISQTERIFKAKYNIPPIRYALNKKLSVAKHLFKTTYLNVNEVAERLAFENVKYFSRQFKAMYGLPPSQYIKKQKNEVTQNK